MPTAQYRPASHGFSQPQPQLPRSRSSHKILNQSPTSSYFCGFDDYTRSSDLVRQIQSRYQRQPRNTAGVAGGPSTAAAAATATASVSSSHGALTRSLSKRMASSSPSKSLSPASPTNSSSSSSGSPTSSNDDNSELILCVDDQELLFGPDDLPMKVFHELQKQGKSPIFMVRPKRAIRNAYQFHHHHPHGYSQSYSYMS